jgi:hypothetical protein
VHKRSWNLLLKICREVEFDWLVVGGDFGDFGSVSMHPKRLPDRLKADGLIDDFDACNAAREELESTQKFKRKIFIMGNHEDRVDRYLAAHPELIGMFSVAEKLALKENSWEVVPYRREIKVGKVWFTHDLGNAGENAHAMALKKAGANIVINHVHRVGYTVKGNIAGKPHIGASFGWLGDISQIDYMSQASVKYEWALGFGVALEDTDGTTFLEPCPIVNNKVKALGRIFK